MTVEQTRLGPIAREREMKMATHRYLIINPRGFSNEFGVLRVRPEDVGAAEAVIRSYDSDPNGYAHWVTRRQAERIVASERSQVRDNNRAGLNSYTNPVGATEIADYEPY